MAIVDGEGFEAARARREGRSRGARWARPLAETLEGRQLLATITVNTTGDADGPDGSNTLSLRQAIEVSNGTLAVSSLTAAQKSLVVGGLSTPDTIDFAIPGTGPFTIEPKFALPSITSPTVIDGYSQPGAHPNTNGPGQGKNTVLEIELDGALAGTGATGLDLTSASTTVEGLAIGGFGVGLSIGIPPLITQPEDYLVQGNFIGTDVTGTKPLPNGEGIAIALVPIVGFSGNTIGGTADGAGNVISGNTGNGLSYGEGCLVEGNFIGTDVTGIMPISNGAGIVAAPPVFLSAFAGDETAGFDTIGGTVAGAGNVISGNGGVGLSLPGSGSLVEGNLIGTDISGTKPLPNGGDGIDVSGNDNTIGGTAAGAGNVIVSNVGAGVKIVRSIEAFTLAGLGIGDTISGNSIFANGAMGILLSGSNTFPIPTYPVITSAIPNGTATSISAILDAAPSTSYTVEFFYNSAPDPSGFGQGQAYLGTTVATTDATGHAAFTLTIPSNLLGDVISATATDPKGNTSEFARDLTAGPTVPSTTTLIGPSAAAVFGHAVTFAAVVAPLTSNGPVPTGMVAFGAGGVILGEAPLDAQGVAVFIINRLPLGSNVVEALYLGDPANSISLSNFVAVPIQPTSPLTSLIGPKTPGVLGQALTFAAIVSPTVGDNTPTGTVFFAEGATILGEAPLNAAGVAVLVTDRLPVGSNVVAAGYLGDPLNATSLSNYVLARVLPSGHGKTTVQARGIKSPHPAGPKPAAVASKSTRRGVGAPAVFG